MPPPSPSSPLSTSRSQRQPLHGTSGVSNAARREIALELLSGGDGDDAASASYASGTTAGPLCLTPARQTPQRVGGYSYSLSDGGGFPRFRVDTPSQLRQRHIQIQVVDQRYKNPSWMHPNIGGEAQHIAPGEDELEAARAQLAAPRHQLGEWSATAIGGNDILSSVLFSAGLTIAKAGKLAPVAQLAVVGVVHCFRGVLEEVMSAVPLNGGCYNVLLSASSKRAAALAATLSMLSYLATGVVCGVSAFNYVAAVWPLPVAGGTVALLAASALLCLVGIAESAAVAVAIFVAHVATLSLLAGVCVVHAARHPHVFLDNLRVPLPDVAVLGREVPGSALSALALGFAQALLGVTGIEASAQFVEEQAPGVFPKTLRNMWALSSVFNVAFALLALAVAPLADVAAQRDVLLAHLARVAGGRWLELLVTADAFAVLAGTVLTSYVGITGLAGRLARDRVLPRALLATNRWRGTPHWTIAAHFVAAASLVLLLDADTAALSGVFAFAFVGVLAAFAASCVALKLAREQLPRARAASWRSTLLCLAAFALALAANAAADPPALAYFGAYLAAVGAVVLVMLERVRVLQALLGLSRRVLLHWRARGRADAAAASAGAFVGSVALAKTIERIKKTPVVFFCKQPNLPKINEAVQYVLRNEQTYSLRLVHVCGRDEAPPREFEDIVCLFDHIYPLLKIDFVSVAAGAFEPAAVEWLAAAMDIPTNLMFMRQPATAAVHAVTALGVRVITN